MVDLIAGGDFRGDDDDEEDGDRVEDKDEVTKEFGEWSSSFLLFLLLEKCNFVPA